jgi:hypothetical protein
MAKMNSNTPVRKVTFGALAGSITTIAIWALNSYAELVFPGWVKIPAEVTSAITVVVTFITSYQVEPGTNEQVEHAPAASAAEVAGPLPVTST